MQNLKMTLTWNFSHTHIRYPHLCHHIHKTGLIFSISFHWRERRVWRQHVSFITQDIPNCWVSTLKAMFWVRHVASLLSLSETRCLSSLKAMHWVRHVASLLSRLCTEWNTLPLYSQVYALIDTHCLSTPKPMLCVWHVAMSTNLLQYFHLIICREADSVETLAKKGRSWY